MPSATHPVTPKEVWTSEEGSMARETAITRWPKTVQNMVEDMEETIVQTENADKVAEGRRIQATLGIIKHEIQLDRPLQYVSQTSGSYSFAIS
jgi:hypothetical protein